MKDVNRPLREAIFSALQAIGEAVFYMQAPDNIKTNYIAFSSLSGQPVRIKTGSKINVNVQIGIFSGEEGYNPGDAVDLIADKVYNAIYPHDTFTLPMRDGFAMEQIDLISDNTNTWRLKNQLIAVDRTITLSFKIYVA